LFALVYRKRKNDAKLLKFFEKENVDKSEQLLKELKEGNENYSSLTNRSLSSE
jgi:hypothetical protein